MTAEQAVNHPSRNVISRALGAEETVQIDLKTSIVHPSTTFLLCSDGITRHIEDWEIAALLSSDGEPAEICRRMKDVCYDRGAEDNLTAVIVRFPGEKTSSKTNGNLITGLETEQLTIAAARPPFDKVVGGDDIILDSSEIETQDLTNRAAVHSKKEDLGFLLADDSDFFVEEPEKDDPAPYTSSSIVVPAHAETVEEHLPVYSEQADEAGEPEGREDFISRRCRVTNGRRNHRGSFYQSGSQRRPRGYNENGSRSCQQCNIQDVSRSSAIVLDGNNHCCAAYRRKRCNYRPCRRFKIISS
jgi:hypothetical protein